MKKIRAVLFDMDGLMFDTQRLWDKAWKQAGEACGVPMLTEDNHLNRARSDHDNGWLFAPDSVDDFAAKLEEIAGMDDEALEKAGENAYNYVKTYYNYDDIARQYIEIIKREYDRAHEERK